MRIGAGFVSMSNALNLVDHARTVLSRVPPRSEQMIDTSTHDEGCGCPECFADEVNEDRAFLFAEIERLREAIDWACRRLEIDDGMTAKQQATTATHLRSILSPMRDKETGE